MRRTLLIPFGVLVDFESFGGCLLVAARWTLCRFFNDTTPKSKALLIVGRGELRLFFCCNREVGRYAITVVSTRVAAQVEIGSRPPNISTHGSSVGPCAGSTYLPTSPFHRSGEGRVTPS
ncbi:hypothetical protein BDZ89DRAFT_417953 [Hymenopellis radicata]|nr:hypothetical protein BDZ89DRAFT_417953 [Hymenopellis radicata]